MIRRVPEARILVARILGAHGVKGHVRIAPLTEDPATFEGLGGLEDEARRPVTVKVEGSVKGALIAALPGVESREAAQALKGAGLYLPRALLPEPGDDEFYFADLVGLKVEEAGETLGEVVAVADYGAAPLLEVKPSCGGATVLVPFTREVVPVVDMAGGRLEVVLPAGLWPGR